ncbi:hypothetical protein MB901379_02429 [Mycobacterium basiliense]|uniref:Uncharacterized protein n=1 Tax=Mycobacterium basiliense TaxID=2094119 RepID=A0A447GEH2_9MYCO|nr:hypothetical protein MB901379_02429 [Mycobacterium basiliense]
MSPLAATSTAQCRKFLSPFRGQRRFNPRRSTSRAPLPRRIGYRHYRCNRLCHNSFVVVTQRAIAASSTVLDTPTGPEQTPTCRSSGKCTCLSPWQIELRPWARTSGGAKRLVPHARTATWCTGERCSRTNPQAGLNGHVVANVDDHGQSYRIVGRASVIQENPAGARTAPEHGQHPEKILLEIDVDLRRQHTCRGP